MIASILLVNVLFASTSLQWTSTERAYCSDNWETGAMDYIHRRSSTRTTLDECKAACIASSTCHGITYYNDRNHGWDYHPAGLDCVLCTGADSSGVSNVWDHYLLKSTLCTLSDTASCVHGDVAIYNPTADENNNVQGLLLTWYNGNWGTVCDDVTDCDCDTGGCTTACSNGLVNGAGGVNLAQVACRSLGRSGGQEFNADGTNSGYSIVVDGTSNHITGCNGDENHLSECSWLLFGSHNCGHSEDVGVICGSVLTGTSVSALLTPAASGITSSQQYGNQANWAASNAVADGDHCVWSAGNQVALQAASKNFVQIDLEQEHTIDKVRGLDVSNLWGYSLYNNFEHGTADIYVCRTAGSGLTAGDCTKCDGAISNTVGSYYDRTCGALTGRYVRVEFLASKGLSANIHFCRLRIYGAPSPTSTGCTVSYTHHPGRIRHNLFLEGDDLIPTDPECVLDDDWTPPFCRNGKFPQTLAIGADRCKIACEARPECGGFGISHPTRGTSAECVLAGKYDADANPLTSYNGLWDWYDQTITCPSVQIPFSIKFGGQAWGMAKSLDNGQTWTPIATVDMHTYQHTHMIGEVRGQAQPGMMLKFQPLHTNLARDLGYHCPYMHQKCDGTCTFDEGRNFRCFNWDHARIFLHEFKINGRVLDFSSTSAMKAGGWTLNCRSPRTSCTPPIQIVGTPSNAGSPYMVRQDGPDFYYTYTFSSTTTESPTLAPTFNPTRNPSNNPTSMPTRNPSSTPTHNPTRNPSNNPTRMPTCHPTLMPTSNPSKPPTAGDYIIKVKGFHGNPAQILDAEKIHSQPKVDVEVFDFERKIAPATRRLLRQLQNSESSFDLEADSESFDFEGYHY